MDNTSLSIKGNFEIKIVKEDGSIRETIKQDNNTTYSYYLDHNIYYYNVNNYGFNSPNFSNSNLHISISGNTIDQGKELYTLDNIYATGAPNSILGAELTPVYATSTNLIGLLEIRERIAFTASIYGSSGYSRTFSTIGITTGIGSNADWTQVGSSQSYTYPISNISSPCYAYILLTTPCTQASNEFLDITYRIQVQGDNFIIINDYLNSLISNNNNRSNTYSYYNFNTIVNTNNSYNYNYYSNNPIPNNNTLGFTLTNSFSNIQRLTGSKKWKYNAVVPSNTLRGQIIRGVLFGKQIADGNGNNLAYSKGLLNFSSTIFQSIYSHNTNANTPYYDLNTLASGTIKPTLSGNWNKDIPELYLIKVPVSGAIGTSTYKFSKKSILGTNGLIWDNISQFTPYVHIDNSPYRNLYTGYPVKITNTNDSEIQRKKFSSTQIVQVDNEKVALINVFTGQYTLWNSNTTPALPTTAIRQFCIVSNLIYVACRATGLWVIDTVANTITNLNTTSCLSVDDGPNKVIALFFDGTTIKLSTSDSFTTYSTNFTFPLSNLYNSSVNNLYFHKVDKNPSATSNRIGIVASIDNSGVTIYWWDSATGTLVNGYGSGVQTIGLNSFAANPNTLVSITNGGWVLAHEGDHNYTPNQTYGVFFNSSSAINFNTGSIPVAVNEHTIVWSGGSLLLPSTNPSVMSPTIIQSGLSSPILPNYNNSSTVYLGNGLCLTSNNIYTPFNNFITSTGSNTTINTTGSILNPYLWNSYYWDTTSSSWLLENAIWNGTVWSQPNGAGKVTHTDIETLNSDVSITFQELGSSGLVATDYYTQILCNGVSLDSITNDFNFTYYWNYLPSNTTIVGSGFTIPNSSPYTLLTPTSVYNSGTSSDSSWGWLETEDVSKHNFNISGYSSPANLVTNINYSPGPNEIVINGSNGNLIFNSTDAGKTITSGSTYTYNNSYRIIANFSVNPPFAGVHRPICLLRSDTGLTISSGVQTWADQSGYGNNAVKLTGTKPTTGTKGSVVTVNFADNASYMTTSNLGFFANGFTVFAYINFTNPGTFFRSNNTGNIILGDFSFYIDSNNKLGFTLYQSNNTYVYFSDTIALSPSNWYLVSITNMPDFKYSSSSSGLLVRVNQANRTLNYNSSVGDGIANEFIPYKQVGNINCIGGDNANPGASFIGQMGFFSVYKNYLTLPEIQLVENGILSIFP